MNGMIQHFKDERPLTLRFWREPHERNLFSHVQDDLEAIKLNRPCAPFCLPWFSSNGFYYEQEFHTPTLGLHLINIDNNFLPNQYPGKWIVVTSSESDGTSKVLLFSL